MEELVANHNKAGISAFTLKMIAIFAMLIDHIAWGFVPKSTLLGQAMHVIGRLTAPIMCYFIAEGYYHTHNVKKYALRLGIFALISHFPFILFEYGRLSISYTDGFPFACKTGVIYTLFLGLISLIVWNSKKMNKLVKIILIVLLCVAALPGDWEFLSVLWILFFGINHNNPKGQILSFIIISLPFTIIAPLSGLFRNKINWYQQLFQCGVFLAIPFFIHYNGKLGGFKYSKWIFYIFYPLHLLILAFIKFGFPL